MWETSPTGWLDRLEMPEFAFRFSEGISSGKPSWRPIRESNPCRRREREAITGLNETCRHGSWPRVTHGFAKSAGDDVLLPIIGRSVGGISYGCTRITQRILSKGLAVSATLDGSTSFQLAQYWRRDFRKNPLSYWTLNRCANNFLFQDLETSGAWTSWRHAVVCHHTLKPTLRAAHLNLVRLEITNSAYVTRSSDVLFDTT